MLLLKILNMNTISKSFIAIPKKFKFFLHVLHKIINKTYVKAKIAQNDIHLTSINLVFNVSKCFTKAQHFETLISSLIQDK